MLIELIQEHFLYLGPNWPTKLKSPLFHNDRPPPLKRFPRRSLPFLASPQIPEWCNFFFSCGRSIWRNVRTNLISGRRTHKNFTAAPQFLTHLLDSFFCLCRTSSSPSPSPSWTRTTSWVSTASTISRSRCCITTEGIILPLNMQLVIWVHGNIISNSSWFNIWSNGAST